ncbi:MAG: thioesterase family protein [Acidimicrobiia bacterium]|nr:thioesterase family protein [Acidimicrobiia bacterium]
MTPELALELVKPISDGIPFNRVIGVTLESMSPTGARMEVAHRDELTNNPASGILHGGVVSSILDVVGGLSALSALVFDRELDTLEAILEVFVRFGTVDLRVDYLRPGLGERFTASSTVMRSGRRLAVTRMEFSNEQGTLLATGTGTYVTG